MLRKWGYNFSKEVKTIIDTESKSVPFVEEKTTQSMESQTISTSISETKQSQTKTSTVKILSLVFKAEIESNSPSDLGNNSSLDLVLNELFDVYCKALKMGSLASLEPLDKVVARIAETKIVAPVIQGNFLSPTLKDHFWKRTCSIVTNVSESETITHESSNKILKT